MAIQLTGSRSFILNTDVWRRFRHIVLSGTCATMFVISAAWAQEKTVEVQTAAPVAVQAVGPDGKPMVVNGVAPGAQVSGSKPGEQKPGEQKAGEQKTGEQKTGDQKAGESAVTQRPTKPETPPNADELKARPDADGKVRFNFSGQPWPAVLEWVATISHMSLDWQELPGDFLNLNTQRAYTVEEARDLINRHLFARGFTILQNGEVLSVVNIKKLDAGMVPRVAPEDLAKRSPYDIVKVSFSLDWMVAEEAAEELKPMISPNGKLTALKSTNRLEVMDAVINLRDIYKVLKEEQSGAGQERLVREFPLQYARASDAVEQLNDLLGLDAKKTPKGPMTPEQMQMQQQQAMMRMQQQQQQQQQGQVKPPGSKDKEQVNLVINARKNSILANAPPDKMAIIEQAVKAIDVPSQGAENLLANLNRMQVYRLGELDPDPLVKTLNELGLLDPSTRLEVDKRNKSIVVYAPLADHLIIRQLIQKLDRTGRTFEVVKLSRLEADQVAGTVEFMINGGEKNDQQQRRPYYYGFGYYMQNQDEQKSSDKFRVDADVENNQLILWANPVELEEVYKLLAKLGEAPTRGANTSTVRVLNLEPGEDTAKALERLRRAWPSLAPNPLSMPNDDVLNGAKGASGPVHGDDARPTNRTLKNEEARSQKSDFDGGNSTRGALNSTPIESRRKIEKSEPVESAAVIAVPAVLRKTVPVTTTEDDPKIDGNSIEAIEKARSDQAAASYDLEQSAERDTAQDVRPSGRENAPKTRATEPRRMPTQPPPVNVSVGPNGELIITSPDTEALDLFEEMVQGFVPQRRDFKVFYLKHASAFNVVLNLEEYFEIDKKKDNTNRRPYYYFGYDDFGSSSNKNDTRRLSKRRELKFIWDTDTNSILVHGADASQLKVIEDLIELYDKQEPPDSRMARMTTVFTLKYSKAKVVGEAVKDVYRDLLSSNDKALQQQGDQQQKNSKRAENVYITNFGDEGGDDPRGTQVKFKGKLSIGIDEFSNTLVVSTEGENLMQNVSKMIESLDSAARPALSRVHVMNVTGTMHSTDVRKALARALIEQQRTQPQQSGMQQGPNGQPLPQQNGQVQPNQQNGPNIHEQ